MEERYIVFGVLGVLWLLAMVFWAGSGLFSDNAYEKTTASRIKQAVISLLVGLAGAAYVALLEPKKDGLDCKLSPALISNHDILLKNESVKDFTDVKVTLTIIGDNSQPKVERLWTEWKVGEVKVISIPKSEVNTIQRVEVSARWGWQRLKQVFKT